MLELSDIRSHLNIDPEDADDSVLLRFLGAAVRRFEHKTGRKLFRKAEDLPDPAPSNAVLLDADIELALLLLIGHWNPNREATSDLSLANIPQGFDELADPYRWWPD
ncbi:head-tail connector protein [Achromobacter xylosoxidans]|uniref:Head-tail connector protein n=1 Tax=Achromobacter sp. HNDS-1 TaxID=3151598 RepID=A0AAU7LF78_9BURK|nr:MULTISPECIES: head-tail connector protein [Achromobacter]MCV6795777.1 head-tail connector protein [Achromobacter ruhlandii]MCV6800817.1 head-tail connector protein [Achromobacter ruhlandii]MCV6807749.1 head-tail connector protein [Achromobacter ruhlandii]MCV6818090.1 head-tail connector protein [Achromobacter ruhlandii]